MLANRMPDEFLPAAPLPCREASVHALFPQWADAPITAPDLPENPCAALLERCASAYPDPVPAADPAQDDHGESEALHLPPPGLHVTGSQLRRRFVTPESIAELTVNEKPSLLQRLLRRK